MAVQSRTFSLDEVNALIPQLENCIQQLVRKKDAYAKEHDLLFMSELLMLAEDRAGISSDSSLHEKEIQGFEEFIQTFEQDFQTIRDLGCVVRSLDHGLVDFLGNWKNEQIYFSWKLGEKKIDYYRCLDGNNSERIPLK